MLQLPILRHCFSSFNSHDLLLVLDIAQALAHLWANIDGFTFSYQTSEYQKFLHLFQNQKSIAEIVYDELCRHLKHQKSPISKFIIISSKQFFLFSLSPSYGIIGNISPQSEIELIVNQWRSQKQQTLVLSSCLQKHTSEGNPVHQLIVGNHSTNITQNCKHYIHFSFRHVRK